MVASHSSLRLFVSTFALTLFLSGSLILMFSTSYLFSLGDTLLISKGLVFFFLGTLQPMSRCLSSFSSSSSTSISKILQRLNDAKTSESERNGWFFNACLVSIFHSLLLGGALLTLLIRILVLPRVFFLSILCSFLCLYYHMSLDLTHARIALHADLVVVLTLYVLVQEI